jgi:hypothetical protein
MPQCRGISGQGGRGECNLIEAWGRGGGGWGWDTGFLEGKPGKGITFEM